MDAHLEFTKWAVGKGVKIYGVSSHRFPNRGLGIVAEEDHESGDVIVEVPTRALRTAHTVPKSILRVLKDITVHGLLAADLSLDTAIVREPWRKVLPSKQDFQLSMPFMWEEALQNLLPPTSKELLKNQKKKFQLDWPTVSKHFPQLLMETYLYNWLVVNTRTFYYFVPGTKRPSVTDDCMALNPFADYFNHAEEGCVVDFDPNGFRITCDRKYKRGEEIYISYGSHSNDFLLTEYGFIMSENKWDEVKLDDIILTQLSSKQHDLLKSAGFLGNYVLDHENVCHRTQVAIRLFCIPLGRWNRFVNGEDDGENDQPKVDQVLLKLLRSYQEHARTLNQKVFSVRAEHPSQKEILARRWQQIVNLLQRAIDRLEG